MGRPIPPEDCPGQTCSCRTCRTSPTLDPPSSSPFLPASPRSPPFVSRLTPPRSDPRAMAPDGLLMRRALDLAQASRQDRGGTGPFRLSGGDLRRALRRAPNASNVDLLEEAEEAAVVEPATGARGGTDGSATAGGRPSTSRLNSSELAGAWRGNSIRPPGLPSSPRANPSPHRRRPRSASPPPASPRPSSALLRHPPPPREPTSSARVIAGRLPTLPSNSTFSPTNPPSQNTADPLRSLYEAEIPAESARSRRENWGASFRERMGAISVAERTSETDAILRSARNALRVAVSFAERLEQVTRDLTRASDNNAMPPPPDGTMPSSPSPLSNSAFTDLRPFPTSATTSLQRSIEQLRAASARIDQVLGEDPSSLPNNTSSISTPQPRSTAAPREESGELVDQLAASNRLDARRRLPEYAPRPPPPPTAFRAPQSTNPYSPFIPPSIRNLVSPSHPPDSAVSSGDRSESPGRTTTARAREVLRRLEEEHGALEAGRRTTIPGSDPGREEREEAAWRDAIARVSEPPVEEGSRRRAPWVSFRLDRNGDVVQSEQGGAKARGREMVGR